MNTYNLTNAEILKIAKGEDITNFIPAWHKGTMKPNHWYVKMWHDGSEDNDIFLVTEVLSTGYILHPDCYFRNFERLHVSKAGTSCPTSVNNDERVTYRSATNEEVEKCLFAEIERRGITEGTQYRSVRGTRGVVTRGDLRYAPKAWNSLVYKPEENGVFCSNNGWIFSEGIFAEKIELRKLTAEQVQAEFGVEVVNGRPFRIIGFKEFDDILNDNNGNGVPFELYDKIVDHDDYLDHQALYDALTSKFSIIRK